MLYIEDSEEINKIEHLPAPTQKKDVLRQLSNSLISVENLAIVTMILRISDDAHPLDVNDFLSVYMYKNQVSRGQNQFKNQLICVE